MQNQEIVNTIALDLGCGLKPNNLFNANIIFGVDIRDDVDKNIIGLDLSTQSLPFIDNYFDFITAIDVIEHISRIIYLPHKRNAFCELMSEIWRVLKPGGLFFSHTPAFPHAAAFQDPTHVNIITDQTFPLYFDNKNIWAKRLGYGFKGKFNVVKQEWQIPHLNSYLIKES